MYICVCVCVAILLKICWANRDALCSIFGACHRLLQTWGIPTVFAEDSSGDSTSGFGGPQRSEVTQANRPRVLNREETDVIAMQLSEGPLHSHEDEQEDAVMERIDAAGEGQHVREHSG